MTQEGRVHIYHSPKLLVAAVNKCKDPVAVIDLSDEGDARRLFNPAVFTTSAYNVLMLRGHELGEEFADTWSRTVWQANPIMVVPTTPEETAQLRLVFEANDKSRVVDMHERLRAFIRWLGDRHVFVLASDINYIWAVETLK